MTTQTERVLRALRREGAHGITQADFLEPGVIDDGPKITRVGARIKDLKDHGYTIRVKQAKRHGFAVYVLYETPVEPKPSLGEDRPDWLPPLQRPAPLNALIGDDC